MQAPNNPPLQQGAPGQQGAQGERGHPGENGAPGERGEEGLVGESGKRVSWNQSLGVLFEIFSRLFWLCWLLSLF